MVIVISHSKETAYEIMVQVCLMGVGGLWYLVVSFIFENLFYKRPESVTIRYTSSYW
jgi:hypothetical protein